MKEWNDDYLTGVKKNDDKLRYKNAILTALYNDGIIQQKLKSMMQRYKVNPDHQFFDDMLQIVFLELSKKSEDQIIERYEEDPRILIGLSVRIMCWKIFSRPSDDNKANSTHSFLYSIFNFSNLHFTNGENDRQNFFEAIQETFDEPNEIYDMINSSLSDEAKEVMIKYKNEIGKLPKRTTFNDYFWRKNTDRLTLTNLINELTDLNKTKNEIMNSRKEIYDAIITINDTLNTYLETRNTKHIDVEKLEEIKRIWKIVNPASNPSSLSSCGVCLKDSLDIMISVRDRLKKEFPDTVDQEVNDVMIDNEVTGEEEQQLIPPSKEERMAKKKANRNQRKY